MITRLFFPGGGPELDFTVGKFCKPYGEVKEIVEWNEELEIDNRGIPITFAAKYKVVFSDSELIFAVNNPLMVVYRKEDKR